jgi:hypothetical protein
MSLNFKMFMLQNAFTIYDRMRCNVVHFQCVFLIKRLITMLTNERLLRRMRSEMRVKSGPQCKTFGADFALEGPLSGMSINMSLQISFLVEALAAIRTVVHVRIRMRAHVVIEVGQLLESAPAFLTLVRFFARVRVVVNAFVDFLVKSLPAVIAFVRSVFGMRFHVRAQIRHPIERFVTLRACVDLFRTRLLTFQIFWVAQRGCPA